MNLPLFQKLRKELGDLKEFYGLTALKTGTEVEDMSFDDVRILKAMCRDIVPLFVKIGGPEARNDIRELTDIGVDGLIAPMIESPYALKNYIHTMRELLSPVAYERVEKGINLETITGFQNMNAILSSPDARDLAQITAARSDLSGSMELSPDDDRVMEICSVIVARSREYDLRTSVGGSITPRIAEKIKTLIRPDTLNTRHMVIDCDVLDREPENVIRRHLRFEVELYQYLSSMPTYRSEVYSQRASVIETRLKASEKVPVRVRVGARR